MFNFLFALVGVLFDGSDLLSKLYSLLGENVDVKEVPVSTKMAITDATFLNHIKQMRLAMVSYVSSMKGKRVRPQVLTYVKKILSEDKGVTKIDKLSLIESTIIGMSLNVSTIMTFLEATNQMMRSTKFTAVNNKLRADSDSPDQLSGLKDLYETIDDLYDLMSDFSVAGSTAELSKKFKSPEFLNSLKTYRADINEADNTKTERSLVIDTVLTSLISFTLLNVLDLFITLLVTEKGIVRFPEAGQNVRTEVIEMFGSLFISSFKPDLLENGMPSGVVDQIISAMGLAFATAQIDGAGKIMIDPMIVDSLNIGIPALLDSINLSINFRYIKGQENILTDSVRQQIIFAVDSKEDDKKALEANFITPFQYGPSVEYEGKIFNGTASFEAIFNGTIMESYITNFPTETGKLLSYDSFNY